MIVDTFVLSKLSATELKMGRMSIKYQKQGLGRDSLALKCFSQNMNNF